MTKLLLSPFAIGGGLCVALLTVSPPCGAAGEAYPERPVRLVVPFPAGGAVDVIGRTVSAQLAERLGQAMVVENRGGANAMIGTEHVARSGADGYTLLIVPAGHAITPNVMVEMPYDSRKDFVAVGFIGNGAYVLVIHPGLPPKSVREFVAYAKARPGKLIYAAAGHGNATHLAAELFKALAGVEMEGLMYKGGGPALVDVISGQASAMFAGIASAAVHLKTEKLRPLGVSTLRRAATLPEVPTIAEAGVPGYEVNGWYGILAPARTPQSIVKRLNDALAEVLRDATTRERLLAVGVEAQALSPNAFAALIEKDIERWRDVVKRARMDRM